jgi:glycosyltransferase involved in cell wall biosynthesis
VTLHNAAPPRGEFLERIIAGRADVVLGASQDLVDRARRLGAKDARFAPVVATLDPPTRTREETRSDLGLTDGVKLVLAVGRLAPQKDYGTLLDAARRIDRRRMLIAVAGGGPLRAELQARIDDEVLPVRLLGHRTDIPDLLAAADVFVMCSTWEARPLALQEAMRAGVSCVATRVGGIPALVGGAAVLVPPGDPERLVDAISRSGSRPDPRSDSDSGLPVPPQEQAATWPGPAEELAAALAAYRS